MGLLSRAENATGLLAINESAADSTGGDASQPVMRKIKISKEDLGGLNRKISEYQKVNRIFGCILFENLAHEKGNADFCEKLMKATSNIGITSPITGDHAIILLPSETDRELIAHRLSKSLNAEPVLSFRAASPEYVMNRINSIS